MPKRIMSAEELRVNKLLVEELKFFMAEKDLTIHDVAIFIKRDPKAVWQFLHQEVKPNNNTIYKVRKLLSKDVKE